MNILNQIFQTLKQASTDMLRKLYRNCQIIFPAKFYQINPETIKIKLDNVCKDIFLNLLLLIDKQWNDRQQTAQIQLRLKFYYRDQPLADVAKLAGDIYTTMPNLDVLEQIFRFKKYVFLKPFKYLTAQDLFDNLQRYKDQRRKQKAIVNEALSSKLKDIFQKQSKATIVTTCILIGGVNQQILNKFHSIKFEELRQLLRQAKPVYDFDKKIFLAISDTQIVESFCQIFNHKPSAALKIKYLTPVQVEQGDQMD